MKGSEQKQFRCAFPGCDKVFNRRDYLERHATNHLSVKPYVCVLCNRHFSRKDLYDNHLTTKRHARVSHEAELANLDHQQLGTIPTAQQIEEKSRANDIAFMQQSQLNAFSPPSSEIDMNHGYDDNEPSYVPPTRQPLHFSGPGPGKTAEDIGIIGSGRNSSLNQDQFAPSQPDSTSSPYYQDSSYRYYSDQLSMEIGSAGSRNSSVSESRLNMNMNWPPNSYSESKMHRSSAKDNQSRQKDSSASGRFSAYGVSLGLDSVTSANTRSEGSTSDENSESDGNNPTALVNERIRRDMMQNAHPTLSLRENPPSIPPLTASTNTVPDSAHGSSPASSSLVSKSMDGSGAEADYLVVKDEGPKESQSTAEAVVAVACDDRYAWFFDDVFNTKMAKIGYDRCYSDSVEIYQSRANEFADNESNRAKNNLAQVNMSQRSMNGQFGQSKNEFVDLKLNSFSSNPTNGNTINEQNKANDASIKRTGSFSVSNLPAHKLIRPLTGEPRNTPPHVSVLRPLTHEKAMKVLSVMHENFNGVNSNSVDQWIQAAWIGADAVKHIVHPATFDPNNTHLALLAVLALIGMSLSEDRYICSAARRVYAPVFLYAYDCLTQLPDVLTPARLDVATVNKFQAFSLLLRYERLVLIGNGSRFTYTRNSPSKYVTDLFLSKALAAIPHVGNFSTTKRQQPIWATISGEGYLFHQGADPEAQWREWTLIEATKRTVHFALYCDSIVTLSTVKPHPVSIFNIDIHMICPDPLWQAHTINEFFHISGPTGILTNIPYLGLIKSLIRFPRIAQNDDLKSNDQELPQIRSPWSVFALKSIAHGLIMIVGKLSGLIPHGDEMLKAVMQSRADPSHSENIFSKFDRQLQARLYRGLDVWYHYFSAAYGDVTDKILRTSGSMSMPLKDEFDAPQSDDDGIPQYALIIVLCHYSSFIFVHEDLPVVLQVTANLKSWLDTHESKSLQMLLDYLYMPLYTNWIRTDEAKGMVSASTLYLAWSHAVAGNVYTGNHMFLSAMIYISVIVVWLYDFANNDYSQNNGATEDGKTSPPPPSRVRLEDFKFMDDAIDYIHQVYKHACGQGPPPQYRAINSVLLLAACLLHKRKSTKPLVEMVLQLLNVMDPDHSSQELTAVVKKSKQVYLDRVAKAKDAMRKSVDMSDDLDSPMDSPSSASSQLSSIDPNGSNDVNVDDFDDAVNNVDPVVCD